MTDRVGAGETLFCVGGVAGEADGLAFGELIGTVGETLGVGESIGDFAGDELGLPGEYVGEFASVAGLVGEGDGAPVICASPEYCTQSSRKATANKVFIFSKFEECEVGVVGEYSGDRENGECLLGQLMQRLIVGCRVSEV